MKSHTAWTAGWTSDGTLRIFILGAYLKRSGLLGGLGGWDSEKQAQDQGEEGACHQGWAAGGRTYILAIPLTDRSTYQTRNFIQLWKIDPGCNPLELTRTFSIWQKAIKCLVVSGGPLSILICNEILIVEKAVNNGLQIAQTHAFES